MRVAIVSGGRGWHVRDLERALAAAGHEPLFVPFQTLQASAASARTAFPQVERVLVRSMPAGTLEQTVFRLAVLHRLEAEGLRLVNRPAALELCVDKFQAAARLAAAGLPTPPTLACQTAAQALAQMAKWGGPVVAKPLFGSEGKGLVKLEDAETAGRVFTAWERIGAVLCLQPFVPNAGFDLRAFVVRGEVVAAMRRQAAAGEWRTNIAQGATAEPVAMSAGDTNLVVRAAAALGAEAAGIDLLPTADGQTLVLEANGVPGWRALAATTGVDVAAKLVAFAVDGEC